MTNDTVVRLISTNNEHILNQVKAALEDEAITFMQKDQGIGSYMRILAGTSAYSSEIYVNESDLKRAERAIDFLKKD